MKPPPLSLSLSLAAVLSRPSLTPHLPTFVRFSIASLQSGRSIRGLGLADLGELV